MTITGSILKDRFEGCPLGLAVGDALGGKFEAQSANAIRARFSNAEQLIAYPQEEIWYTDDTQMAIGVSEALLERGEIVEDVLCRAFVANYVPSRGYGRGARAVLEAMEEGRDYRQVAEQHFPGGSFGNGAAMRVAPIGLLFRDDHQRLWEQARLSARPTHLHPLGIEGAQLLALAVALCSNMERFDRDRFFTELLAACESEAYRAKLEAARVRTPNDLAELGNRIEALHSVPTAIASFALTPESFEATISNVIFLGGDTDTLAAMAGALSGSYVGARRLPGRLVGLLESSPKGRKYLWQLAGQLFAIYHRGWDVSGNKPNGPLCGSREVQAMIEVRDLVKNHDRLRVLDGVSLTVRRGEVAVLIGPSGGGKSTLLRCINGLESFQQGEVRVDDIVLRPGAAAEREGILPRLRRRVGMVFQQFHLFPHLRVLDNVMSGPLWTLRQRREEAEEPARQLLDRVGLADKIDAWPEQLSGGQQQRVAIARALAMKPEAILFDEPTSALDPRMAGEVLRVIADLAASGQTMIVVTHAMSFARRVAHTVHVMHAGRIAESGPPEQIFEQSRLEVTRSFLVQVTAD